MFFLYETVVLGTLTAAQTQFAIRAENSSQPQARELSQPKLGAIIETWQLSSLYTSN